MEQAISYEKYIHVCQSESDGVEVRLTYQLRVSEHEQKVLMNVQAFIRNRLLFSWR